MKDRIWDAEDLAQRLGAPDARALTRRIAQRAGHVLRAGIKGEVRARLEHGRWIADCPACNGAEVVSRQAREFYCLSCGNAASGGQPMRVVFPRDRAKIEAVLEMRAGCNQHWRPGDTVEELRALNRAHGLPEAAERAE